MNKKGIITGLAVIAVLVCTIVSDLRSEGDLPVIEEPYLGQKPPGIVPEVFAPGIVSTEASEWSITISACGKHLLFTRWNTRTSRHASIIYTRFVDGSWTQPAPAPFSSDYHEMEAAFSPDMKRLYYNSSRPYTLDGEEKTSGIWCVESTDTGWGEPRPLGSFINDVFSMMVSAATNGNLYFTGTNDNEVPDSDLFYVTYDGSSYSERKNLGDAINSSFQESHSFISEDESYILFDSDRPGGAGQSDLYVSFRNQSGAWSVPANITGINSEKGESMPFVSPDGKYLFFSRFDDNGPGDIYWVSSELIMKLK